MLFVAWGFATSPLALDPEASFERHGLKGYGIGGIALVGLPCLLNVVNLWIDVAMGAMNKGGTKTQRAATKKKVNCMVYTITAISSSLVIVLILSDLIQYVLAFLIVMAILMGCVYAYGGFMLSKALSQGMATDAESGGGCCKTSDAAKKDMNCYMVTMTANKIAYSMGGAVLGAVGYFVFPSRPNVPYLPEASVVRTWVMYTRTCERAATSMRSVMDGWAGGRAGGRAGGQVDGRTDERTNERALTVLCF